jgi:nicotinate dehydrogenase subunit A
VTASCGAEPLHLQVNGQAHSLSGVPREASLLHLLRNDLGLNGPKYGCGLGQCGACTVHVDGVAARSCVIPAHGVAGRSITTLEGLLDVAPTLGTFGSSLPPEGAAAPWGGPAARRGRWHPVQAAFEDAQAAQCGYCLNGMVMQAAALLARDPQASEARIRSELSGNLCRCGTHIEILDAVQRAAVRMRTSHEDDKA